MEKNSFDSSKPQFKKTPLSPQDFHLHSAFTKRTRQSKAFAGAHC